MQQYIAVLQYLASYWQREGVHVNNVQSASYEVQNIGSLGDLGHDHKKFHWIVLAILAKSWHHKL